MSPTAPTLHSSTPTAAPDPAVLDLIAAELGKHIPAYLRAHDGEPEFLGCSACEWGGGEDEFERHQAERVMEVTYLSPGSATSAELRSRIVDLEEDVARRQAGAEIIGALHAQVCDSVPTAVGVDVAPDGDADWAAIFECLAELGADRDHWKERALRVEDEATA
ncbi:MAG: hypothetical protein WBD41_19845 [Rhodococcus sp. (in: high G+C Gram-positive bacteria)]|jgi:hypothetical protein|uniref:hypothetical protein n=1 Tax=Rhodococcus sp. KRD162 TaxID=2729725 RepID=UPI0019D0D8CD|nr:hypothetical protein [Rhodococcus sp. KRD162]